MTTKFNVPYIFNPGVLVGRLPDKLFKKVQKAILDPRARTTPSLKHDLVGSISNEFITPDIPELVSFVGSMYEEWQKIYETDPAPYKIEPIWTNYMKAGEFNPNHSHPGALAVFVLWMQIPYDIEEEMAVGGYENPKYPAKNSCFEFTYSKLDGTIINKPIYVDKSYEGMIIMFPSTLMHCVYPFRTSDGERISIAGNIYPV
jgi:hypothetical protein